MEYNAQITYRELYRQGVEGLQKAQIAEAELDARLLLEWCCGTNRNTLLVHGERSISAEEFEKYEGCISKRTKHIPICSLTIWIPAKQRSLFHSVTDLFRMTVQRERTGQYSQTQCSTIPKLMTFLLQQEITTHVQRFRPTICSQ